MTQASSIRTMSGLAAALALAGLAAAGALADTPATGPAPKAAPPFYADKSNVLTYVDQAGQVQPVRTPAHWRVRRGHILESMQQVMGPLPPPGNKVPPDVKVVAERIADGVIRRKITLASEKGDRVPAWLLIPAGLAAKAPAVLCLHQTIAIGKDEPAGLGGSDNLHYGLELAKRGYVTLCPDYPNFGEYKCDPYAARASQRGSTAPKGSSTGYASATMKGVWNHMRAIDVLEATAEVDAGRIGCIGHSLGGHNAIFLAAFDDRVKAVVSSCGFNSFAKYAGGDLAGWSHAGYMPRIASLYGKDPRKMPFDFTEVLAALAPRPVFINAPLRDSNFEVSGVRDCLAAAGPVYALLGAADKLVAVHPDAGHDFPPAVRTAAYEFLDSVLIARKPPGSAQQRPDVPGQARREEARPEQRVDVDHAGRDEFGAELLEPGEVKQVVELADHPTHGPRPAGDLVRPRLAGIEERDDPAGYEVYPFALKGKKGGEHGQFVGAPRRVRHAHNVLQVLAATAHRRADHEALHPSGRLDHEVAAVMRVLQGGRPQE